jgi:hypothetical protein
MKQITPTSIRLKIKEVHLYIGANEIAISLVM